MSIRVFTSDMRIALDRAITTLELASKNPHHSESVRKQIEKDLYELRKVRRLLSDYRFNPQLFN